RVGEDPVAAEVLDRQLLEVERPARYEVDAVVAAEPVQRQPTQRHHVGRPRVDGDRVAAEGGDSSVDAGWGDQGDRAADVDRAVAARVERDHLAASGGLGDRGREVAAGQGDRAGV